MNDDAVSETIRQFFGGNFHQDWDLVAAEWEGVVDQYAAGKSPTRLSALAREIDTLRATHDEEALTVLMPRQALSAYAPLPPTTYKEWLGQIADRLRVHARAVESGGTPEL
ncbi:hypothetical protein A5727_23095 [Mycobacterium sp. ACS4331]|nr:hypothetical protein A5727_23095 [Mycobacterium sp. ACS4331]